MKPFAGQEYDSFAAFFARKRNKTHYVRYVRNEDILISPCDGLLTIYPVSEKMQVSIKGSCYQLKDMIPNKKIANHYEGGLCLIIRLQAHDYHHFCSFDDLTICKTGYKPGLLHSVQPIACETVPVYRLNRRWWSILKTKHFGTAVQLEIGAMAIGEISLAKTAGYFQKGEEMGNFELAGSTIVLFLQQSFRERLRFFPKFKDAVNGKKEVCVKMGEGIGSV